jgi:hypothetical protein
LKARLLLFKCHGSFQKLIIQWEPVPAVRARH